MSSVKKQIFLILSILSLVSALEKGVSARKPSTDSENRRRLKKGGSKKGYGYGGYGNVRAKGGYYGGSGFVAAPTRYGAGTVPGPNGVNRDGTPVGQLIQPPGKSCIPFDDARKWLTDDYPGDIQCRVEFGQMPVPTACCRVFTFTDTNGPKKWLLFDVNNQYKDLIVRQKKTTSNLACLKHYMLTHIIRLFLPLITVRL